ncbi:MAG: hypothetical protein QMB52_11590, partial [Propionivibrio sp.]
MQRHISTKKSEKEGLFVQRTPLYCRSNQNVMYRLDVSVAGRISPKLVDEWSVLVQDLKRLRTPFLIGLDNGLEVFRSVELPSKMQFERPDHALDGNLYRIGEHVFVLGWEALYQESSV